VANRDLKLKCISIRKAKAEEEKVKNTRTDSKTGTRFPCFSKSEMASRWHAFESHLSKDLDGLRLTGDEKVLSIQVLG